MGKWALVGGIAAGVAFSAITCTVLYKTHVTDKIFNVGNVTTESSSKSENTKKTKADEVKKEYDEYELSKLITFDKVIKTDFNGDAKEEELSFVSSKVIDNGDYSMNIGGGRIVINRGKTSESYVDINIEIVGDTIDEGYYICDLDKNDGLLDILVPGNMDTELVYYYIYRYDNNKLYYFDFINEIDIDSIKGDGKLETTMRADFIDCMYGDVNSVVTENGIEIPEQWINYPEDTKHNTLKDITIYTKPDLNSEKTIINKGTEVTFIKYINSDMFDEKDYYNKWAEVKYGDSTGYVHMYTEYNVDNNGALESSEDIFENLARFG
ncbi:MAG: hypothetical protein K6G26_00675 [Lachnospiraceae bacterium]|nr:hypothetical protein [Lachnospiraceae bacterium]